MTAAPSPESGANTTVDAPPLLSAAGLRKSFGSTAALRGADLDVRAGEITAVLGPSGSGKSTLLQCVAGIVRPDAGRVSYAGQHFDALDDAALSEIRRTEFGFVFQFGQLIPELTCVQNAALPLRLAGAGRRAAEVTARDWLLRLEVDDVAEQRPGQVSGGQAQRVAVARALIHRPSVIFADEPTGALDTLQGERVMALLVEVVRDRHSALVLITHEPRVAAYSDREVLVRDGRTSAS